MTGLHHKSLTRLMNGSLEREPRRRQRKRYCGADVDDALCVIDRSLDYICADHLTPSLAWMAEQLAAHGEMVLTAELWDKSESISVSTVKRILMQLPDPATALRLLGAAASRADDYAWMCKGWDRLESSFVERLLLR